MLILVFGVVKYYSVYSEDLTPIDEKKEYYNISDFGFIRETSKTDYDKDGIDDYTEYLNGEKQYVKWNPSYISNYYAGGYPKVEKEGVCTDVVWYALQTAGYDLKTMMDKDIEENYKKGTYNIEVIDKNIDFRRVRNLDVYLKNNSISLTKDLSQIEEWQGGDIIVFKDHIGIISDKRNKKGIPFLIHHANPIQVNYEEDVLELYGQDYIIGHYRIS